MRLGVHISGVDKIYETLERAHELGCNTMQIFSRNPQRWRLGFLSPAEISEFIARKEKFRINPVFIHISYLINLASPDLRLYDASIEAYIEDILEAQVLRADFIVTHMGSHKETSEEAGIERLTSAINTILERTKGSKVGILLENTSGSGSWLGYKFIHQRQIIKGIKQKERVGLCLDTAHAYLAGYDISTREGLEGMLGEIEEMVGLSQIKLIHLNDARGELGSHHDRHEHMGKGGIGLEGMRRIINHPRLRDIPFILETPKDSESADTANLKAVRKLRK
ncbi:MAG TPA: deoxyribonuclease IV [Candidatus Margulisiibacteriota bacterium]|nr:deoxyribonuclease IV [Candidatus Margulisiibacteriota bacterium]